MPFSYTGITLHKVTRLVLAAILSRWDQQISTEYFRCFAWIS